jgi:hypothetical protein
MYYDKNLHARFQIFGLLERVCQELDLTEAQYEQAKKRYEGVGTWLAESTNPLLMRTQIYAQGSMALRTTNKPL